MRRKALSLLLLFIAGCSGSGPQADLQYISGARSLAAEWAMVNEQASAGHVTAIYARTMRAALRQQIQSNAQSLTEPNSAYGAELQALLKESDDASPKRLRAHANKLKAIEDSLESA
jgi:hypothetical protein